MLKLQGKGAFKDRNLIVGIREQSHEKSGKKGYYMDAQVDQSLVNPESVLNGKTKAEVHSDPHLVSTSQKFTNKQGETQYATNHGEWYQMSQAEALKKAAGKNIVKVGKVTYCAVQADLTKNAKGHLIFNSKTLRPTTNKHFGADSIKQQDAVTKAVQKLNHDNFEANKKAEPSKAPSVADTVKTDDAPKNEPKAASKGEELPF